mmetsp:Transcript_35022/g.112472  ORF Transcript_35022/g.112472 Transcript_35022/m.112472 type:complete len:202 (+) Transcript_35022:1806-2411(+)
MSSLSYVLVSLSEHRSSEVLSRLTLCVWFLACRTLARPGAPGPHTSSARLGPLPLPPAWCWSSVAPPSTLVDPLSLPASSRSLVTTTSPSLPALTSKLHRQLRFSNCCAGPALTSVTFPASLVSPWRRASLLWLLRPRPRHLSRRSHLHRQLRLLLLLRPRQRHFPRWPHLHRRLRLLWLLRPHPRHRARHRHDRRRGFRT